MVIDNVITEYPITYWKSLLLMPLNDLGMFLLTICICTIGALVIGITINNRVGEIKPFIGKISLIVSFMLLYLLFGLVYTNQMEGDHPQLKGWSEEYLLPYVQTLEPSAAMVLDYELIGKSKSNRRLYEYLNITREEFIVNFLVELENKLIEIENVRTEIVFDENLNNPVLSYKFISELSDVRIPEDYYFATLFLPRDFEIDYWNGISSSKAGDN